MKVIQEKLPASQIGLEIEITPEASKQAYEKTLQDFMRSMNIPGFRKGKVPRQVLIQRLGSTRIKAAVIEELIDSSLKQAIEQEKIEAIGNFELRSPFEELINQFDPGSAFTFSAAVDVSPTPTLDQYQGFQIQAEEIAYKPERVDEVLESYRNRMSTLVPVENRAAQEGDVAVVDFTGRLAQAPEEGSDEIPGGSATDFEIELTEGRFIEGFIEGIIGMTPGESKDVEVSFPEGYPQPDLAGKAAVFSITLKDLKEKELPELDDDFAQDVSDFETLQELRDSLEARFKKEVEEKTQSNKEQAILNELVKHIQVDLPETLIKQEINYMLTQTAMQLERQGMDIKQMFTPEMVQRLREQSRPEAISRIQRTMALGEVAKRESIKVEPAEIEAKVNEMLQDFAGQDIDINRLRQVVEEDLLKEKIFAWLEEHSTLELVPEGSLAPAEAPVEEAQTDTPPAEETAVAETPVASEATVEATAVAVPDAPVATPAPSPEKATKSKKSAEPETASTSAAEPTEEKSAEPAKKTSRSTKKTKGKAADTDSDATSSPPSEEV
ncbi:trigger factor [Oscillatoria sp. FACHB-1407]|uniref:trigger factor n=1 Tax=Oscillatoria sp. FACHB-1407 TaxID=2692847 RepID=UPI001685F555|nr:trigger factor [Oscillatoria sp. FACHB-1407]MBD2463356.1 trigger factor [Oscillatoria sp. FACHB-1407]